MTKPLAGTIYASNGSRRITGGVANIINNAVSSLLCAAAQAAGTIRYQKITRIDIFHE